jgi:hypothetical protein
MDIISAALTILTGLVSAYPFAAMSLLAFGPIAIALLSRNPVGAVIVIGLVIMGLGPALDVTRDGISFRPFDSTFLLIAFAIWGTLGQLQSRFSSLAGHQFMWSNTSPRRSAQTSTHCVVGSLEFNAITRDRSHG